MRQPLISCIMPAFNAERFITESLDSILAQTYQSIEVIVIDDGSTDRTRGIIASYGEKVRYSWQSNAGPPQARNAGIRSARGDFIAFLDADDLWHPEKLARQMSRFEARPQLEICVTHLQRFWIAQLEDERRRFEGHRFAEVLPGYVTVTLLARRAIFDTVGLFDTSRRVGDPMDWFLRAAEQNAIMELLPEPLVFTRMHENNISVQPNTRHMTASMQDAILNVIKASLDRRRKTETRARPLEFPPSKRVEKP